MKIIKPVMAMNSPTRKWHDKYTIPRRFHPESTLLLYLKNYSSRSFFENDPVCSMDLIFNQLRKIISTKQLFDDRNQSIILCDKELEVALKTKYLSFYQLPYYAGAQMCPKMETNVTDITTYLNLIAFGRTPNPPKKISTPNPPKKITPRPAAKEPEDPNSTSYCLKPSFLETLRLAPENSQTQILYTYPDITHALTNYFALNPEKYFDPRNTRIIYIKDDPLEEDFNVAAFHDTQLRELVSKVTHRIDLNSFLSMKLKYPTLRKLSCRKVSEKTIKKD